MSTRILATERFQEADSFLQALHPRGARWSTDTDRWVFRGHADATWKLVPAAFRRGAFAEFGSKELDLTASPENLRSSLELLVLRRFSEALDRAGLPVPGLDRAALERLIPATPNSPQWPRQYVEVAALAQHHGVPTRLLDLTRSAHVAAYFAAQLVHQPQSEWIAVWAIREGVFSYGDRCDGVWFSLLRASRATNPNLHAQSGLFAAWTGPTKRASLDRIVRDVATSKIRLLSGQLQAPWPTPTMRKLLLPRDKVPDLLRLLVYERISGATMFPGVDGVVRAIKEESIHRGFDAPF